MTILTIRKNFARPPEAALAPFRDAPTGWIVDANGRRGALDIGVRPITKATRFCGAAITVWSRARDNLAPYAAIEFARPGDVMVIATDGYTEASVIGDVLAGMAKNKGVAAIVTDGTVRDVEGLNAVGIPVFARGLTPNSPHKDGPGEIGLSVTLAGQAVASGDLVAGDENGVVVVPGARVEEVAAGLAAVKKKEVEMDALVRAGATAHPWLKAILDSDKVRYVD
jgi:4-hydroxy-4-methyl-2-oxoglutarate aldolase